jgi:hypothetical protein
VDEDLLSPQLGRLIDEAKAAARRAGQDTSGVEGVALLTAAGTVYAGHPGGGAGRPPLSPAEMALTAARQAGHDTIVAAAAAVPTDRSETVLPSTESRRILAAVDPQLPIVFKQRGRWVMLPLAELESRQ